jgi:hypothetical protein
MLDSDLDGYGRRPTLFTDQRSREPLARTGKIPGLFRGVNASFIDKQLSPRFRITDAENQ